MCIKPLCVSKKKNVSLKIPETIIFAVTNRPELSEFSFCMNYNFVFAKLYAISFLNYPGSL